MSADLLKNFDPNAQKKVRHFVQIHRIDVIRDLSLLTNPTP